MKKSKMMNGITLIALVITIIVLLILAGVTVATLTGDNGVLTKAKEAKTETTKAGAKEQARIAVMGSFDTDGNLNYKKLKENLKSIGVTEIPNQETFPLTVTIDGEKIEIKQDGTVEEGFDAEEWDKTATDEECFIWEDTTIIGLNMDKLAGVEKLKIPSKCTKIRSDYSNSEESYRNFVTGIKIVELPKTVTEIGDYAFLNFKQLEDIEIPNRVKRIGDWSFSWCKNLKEIDIPDSVEEIGNSAFNCSDITRVKLPSNLKKINNGAFMCCEKLKEITIPNSVMSIESSAFDGCVNLSNINISNKITSIGYKVFGGWTSSQTINIQGCSSAPSGWDSRWNENCSATINWNQ